MKTFKYLSASILLLMMVTCEKPAEADTESPTVMITNPANHEMVKGMVIITAKASDNVEVVQVDFYIDDQLVSSDVEIPWEYVWNTATVTTGEQHSIQVKAFDEAGNIGSSSYQLVTIESPEVPVLSINPLLLDFGTDRIQLSLSVINTGTGTLNWSSTITNSRLSCVPESGSTVDSSQISVTVSRQGLQPGIYYDTIWISAIPEMEEIILVTMAVEEEYQFEPQLISVPAGDFRFGPDATIVSLNYDFEIMTHEVTNRDYAAFLNEAYKNGQITIESEIVTGPFTGDENWGAGDYSYFSLSCEPSRISFVDNAFQVLENLEDHPVTCVSYFGAVAFAEHHGMDIPTGEEWEKAARGNNTYDYPWGEMSGHTISDNANYNNSGDPWDNGTSPVGYFNGANGTTDSPSPFGAYDMSGNLSEWTSTYQTGTPGLRFRGGSWNSHPLNCVVWREKGGYAGPSVLINTIGFRCIKKDGEAVNRAPLVPTSPFPTDGTNNTDTNLTLTWNSSDPDGDPLTYSVFFDTLTPPSLSAFNLTSKSFIASSLAENAKYFWQVQASDGELTKAGPIWSFSTRSYPDPPILSVTPTNLDFGSSHTQLSFSISNIGTGTVNWTISKNQDWMNLSSVSGSTSSETDQINVMVSREGLAPGHHTGTITVLPNIGIQKTISVNLTVLENPILAVTPSSLDFGTHETELPLTIKNIGTGELDWTVESDQDWISPWPPFGSTSSDSTQLTIRVLRSGLEPGIYNGTVTVIPESGSSVTISVTAEELEKIPSAPVLLTPQNTTTVSSPRPRFDWEVPEFTRYLELIISESPVFVDTLHYKFIDWTFTSLLFTTFYNGQYYWKVRASNEEGIWGDWSETWSFIVNESTALTPILKSPENGAVTESEVVLDWDGTGYTINYWVMMDDNNDFTSPIINIDNLANQNSHYVIPDPLDNGTFYWKVRSILTGGNFGHWSETWSFNVSSIPGPISLVSPTNGSDWHYQLQAFYWTKTANAYSYEIMIDGNMDFSSPEIHRENALVNCGFDCLWRPSEIEDQNLTQGTTYYWKVRAKNEQGTSGPWSEFWSFRKTSL